MRNRLFAMLLAGVMTLSLTACGEKQVQTDINGDGDAIVSSDGNAEILPEDPIGETAIPEDLDVLISVLEDNGYTAEYKILGNKGSDFFLYPEFDFSCVVNVSNGEELYLYGYMNVEKAEEHMACYGRTGNEYSKTNSDGTVTEVSIDYVGPIQIWRSNGWMIEYASSYGELYDVITEALGEPKVGSGTSHYYPNYISPVKKALEAKDYMITIPEASDSSGKSKASIYYNGEADGALYVYKYETVEELMNHTASPIEPPVLETLTVWVDVNNLVAYEYVGDDENIHLILDDTFMSGAKQLSVNNLQFIKADYIGGWGDKPTVEVFDSYDKLTGGVQLDLGESHPYIPYTREWFEDNTLIKAIVTENSGSNRHELVAVTKSGDSVTVNIRRIIPEVVTCDMATWEIYLGVPKKEIDGNTTVNVNMIDPDTGLSDSDYLATTDENIIRTDYFGDGFKDSIVVINSFKELEEYYNNNKDVFFLEGRDSVYADTSIGFKDTFAVYNEEWFKENILFMGIVEEGSGSVRHRFDGITRSADGALSLRYTTLLPEIGTDDMACWHIMAGVNRADVGEVGEVSIYCNEGIPVEKTLFPAEYITAERIADVKKIMIGNYNWQDIRNFWGKPDGMLSGMWGEIYNLGDDAAVCVYYDSSAVVEEVLLSLSGKHVYTLNDITEDNFENIKKIIIDHKWTLEELEKVWGEPSHKDQSDKSYTWDLSGGVSLVVTEFDYVDMIIPYVKNPLDSIPWLSVVSKSNLKTVSEHLVGNYTIVDVWDAWGEPKGALYEEVAYGYEMSDGGIIWVYYKGTEGYVDKLVITDSIVFVEDFALENVTADNIIQFEAFFMGSTYKEVVDFWGRPYDETAGVGQALYQIEENMFVAINFNSDSVVESVELLSRTPIEPRGVAVDKLSSPLYCLSDIEWLNEQLVGQVDYKWLWEKWGKPEIATFGEDIDGDGWIIMDNVLLMVYYDSNDMVEKVTVEGDSQDWEDNASGLIRSKLVGKYTYQEVIDMWGMPIQKISGRWGMLYKLNEKYNVALYFDETDLITEAELLLAIEE